MLADPNKSTGILGAKALASSSGAISFRARGAKRIAPGLDIGAGQPLQHAGKELPPARKKKKMNQLTCSETRGREEIGPGTLEDSSSCAIQKKWLNGCGSKIGTQNRSLENGMD